MSINLEIIYTMLTSVLYEIQGLNSIVFMTHCMHTYLTIGHKQEGLFSDGRVPSHCSGYGALLDPLRAQQFQIILRTVRQVILNLYIDKMILRFLRMESP